MVTVWNVYKHGLKAQEGIYIGRAGKGQDGYWGNPVAVGHKCSYCSRIHTKGGDTLPCYRQYLETRLANDAMFLMRFVDMMSARKDLVCFCAPSQGLLVTDPHICHGQVMIDVFQKMRKESSHG